MTNLEELRAMVKDRAELIRAGHLTASASVSAQLATWMPALLDEIESLRKERDEARALLREAAGCFNARGEDFLPSYDLVKRVNDALARAELERVK